MFLFILLFNSYLTVTIQIELSKFAYPVKLDSIPSPKIDTIPKSALLFSTIFTLFIFVNTVANTALNAIYIDWNLAVSFV